MKLKYASCLLLLVIFSLVSAQAEHGTTSHGQPNSSQNTKETGFAEREGAVMPFDLDATQHIFEDTATGGVQWVIADDPGDKKNIALIRSHLAAEAESFAKGEFADPSFLHGAEMPGLTELKAAGKAGTLTVSYRDLKDGGEIAYNSEDAEVVTALHRWFQAQVTDHGENATD